MLPLHTFGKIEGDVQPFPMKVLGLKEALKSDYPFERIALLLDKHKNHIDLSALKNLGFTAIITNDNAPIDAETNLMGKIHTIRNPGVVKAGDVIRVRPNNGQISVLYRRGANANSLFVTERCNSKCLMCSQPPRDEDDSWIVEEILSYLPLIDNDVEVLGITGGEPTLLGSGLNDIIDSCKVSLPNTMLHILTNGRNFADGSLAANLSGAVGRAVWAVPLYSDLPHIHDYVVQADNAFNDTLNGIYHLAEHGHLIEIRLVIHKQTIDRIQPYVEFIYRNLPFVSHVALMGLEPMGYAKVNRESLWIDPADYAVALTKAAWFLEDRKIRTSIYNIPLCVLPELAWPLAKQSISDWKNVYDSECEKCDVRSECCGFFASYGPAWRSREIKAITTGLGEKEC